jgi:hypothetical protein
MWQLCPHEWSLPEHEPPTPAEQIAAAQRYARRYSPGAELVEAMRRGMEAAAASVGEEIARIGAALADAGLIPGYGVRAEYGDPTGDPPVAFGLVVLDDGPGSYRPLDGCSCGGIGDTGSHRPGCPWAVQRGQ